MIVRRSSRLGAEICAKGSAPFNTVGLCQLKDPGTLYFGAFLTFAYIHAVVELLSSLIFAY